MQTTIQRNSTRGAGSQTRTRYVGNQKSTSNNGSQAYPRCASMNAIHLGTARQHIHLTGVTSSVVTTKCTGIKCTATPNADPSLRLVTDPAPVILDPLHHCALPAPTNTTDHRNDNRL